MTSLLRAGAHEHDEDNVRQLAAVADAPDGYVYTASSGHGLWLPASASGASGSLGPMGMDGEQGEEGAMGPPGPRGADGAPGAPGGAGATGPAGAIGLMFSGEDGDEGPPGPPGPRGADGAAGATGATGSAGAMGLMLDGEDGEEGWMGPPGRDAEPMILSTVEVSLESAPNARRSGNFQITGLAGLTAGTPVVVRQAEGPYTGKGTRGDEAEMDSLNVSGKVLNATTIQCRWEALHRVRGNYKFDYAVAAAFANTLTPTGLTPPVDAEFSWVNQGLASVTPVTGLYPNNASGIYLLAPVLAGINLKCRVKAAPSPPYVITACILPQAVAQANAYFGLLFREVATGEIHTFHIECNSTFVTGFVLEGTKWTSATGFSAHYAGAMNFPFMSPLWLRIADDNTNRICSFSSDGRNWITFHTVGRTDFLTADQVGFFAMPFGSPVPSALTLISWKQE